MGRRRGSKNKAGAGQTSSETKSTSETPSKAALKVMMRPGDPGVIPKAFDSEDAVAAVHHKNKAGLKVDIDWEEYDAAQGDFVIAYGLPRHVTWGGERVAMVYKALSESTLTRPGHGTLATRVTQRDDAPKEWKEMPSYHFDPNGLLYWGRDLIVCGVVESVDMERKRKEKSRWATRAQSLSPRRHGFEEETASGVSKGSAVVGLQQSNLTPGIISDREGGLKRIDEIAK